MDTNRRMMAGAFLLLILVFLITQGGDSTMRIRDMNGELVYSGEVKPGMYQLDQNNKLLIERVDAKRYRFSFVPECNNCDLVSETKGGFQYGTLYGSVEVDFRLFTR